MTSYLNMSAHWQAFLKRCGQIHAKWHLYHPLKGPQKCYRREVKTVTVEAPLDEIVVPDSCTMFTHYDVDRRKQWLVFTYDTLVEDPEKLEEMS